MYSAVVLFVLIAAVSAGQQRPLIMLGKPMPPPMNAAQPEPGEGHCCAEPYYTYEASDISVTSRGGELFSVLVLSRGAYDSIDKKIGLHIILDFSNGTEDKLKLIADYKKGEGYFILDVQEGIQCTKFPITSGFPYNCLPEESVYAGSVTVGDRAMRVANYYYHDRRDPSEEVHIVYSIKHPECIDVGATSRAFDPDTGEEIRKSSIRFYNYNLGICDPDKYFKPPYECEAAEITEEVPKRLIGLHGPGGKRMVFQ